MQLVALDKTVKLLTCFKHSFYLLHLYNIATYMSRNVMGRTLKALPDPRLSLL